MNAPDRLNKLDELMAHAADVLTVFAHHAKHRSQALYDTRQTARDLAMKLLPEYDTMANVGGLDTRQLRHAGAGSLLRLSALARTDEATTIADGAAASPLAQERLTAANALHIEAAGLE